MKKNGKNGCPGMRDRNATTPVWLAQNKTTWEKTSGWDATFGTLAGLPISPRCLEPVPTTEFRLRRCPSNRTAPWHSFSSRRQLLHPTLRSLFDIRGAVLVQHRL